MNNIVLNGNNLTIEEVNQLLENPDLKVALDSDALTQVKKSEKYLREHLKGKIIYGINTGFGPMASHILADDQLVALQENLVRSHATGVGDPIDQKFVLASMVVRLNTLVKGYSGISEELLRQLEFFINNRIIPVIPEHGAVGTSGDLIQLAHIAQALIGEGEVYYQGKISETKTVLKELNRSHYQLKPKEGLALINGTSVMTGIASVVAFQAQRLLDLAVLNGGLALEVIEAYSDGISEKLHEMRPHEGQIAIAAQLRKLLIPSALLKRRSDLVNNVTIHDKVQTIPQDVQEVYSIRCIPQILGPVYETLQNAKKIIETEMNSVTDNPVINENNGDFLHGGNFHGDYVASVIDQLKISLVKLTMLSERRTNFFLNHKINLRFPPFLNLSKPGLTLALQPLQFVSSSTTAQSQTLAYPHHLHSIPTNADNQDVVSMGTDAALMADKVVDNAYVVQTIELIALCQAVDFCGYRKKLSGTTGRIYDDLRSIFPAVTDDRSLTTELNIATKFLKQNQNIDLDWNQ